MPPQTTIDIQAALAAVHELLETLAAPAGTKALQALSPARDALAGPGCDEETVACDKDGIGWALDQAIEHAVGELALFFP